MGNANNFVPQDYITWFDAVEYAYNPVTKNNKLQEICNLGLTKFPDNPDILYCYTHLKDDKDPKKLDYLYKILKQEFNYRPISFDFGTIYNNIAWILHLNNQSSKGLPYAENAVKKESSHDYSWETLGEIYYSLGRYQDCIDAMSKCIEISGDKYKTAYQLRGKSYRALGKKKEASQDEKTANRLK